MGTSEQIKHMVERFLNWRLPENFNPDGGISFKPTFNENSPHGPMKHEPTGTNLFGYTQAEAMVRHMLEGMPMTTTKPARQQVVEALTNGLRSLKAIRVEDKDIDASSTFNRSAETIADILVRAGIAEEPRERGLYQTPERGIYNLPAMWWDGTNWYEVLISGAPAPAPSGIGQRILPPQD